VYPDQSQAHDRNPCTRLGSQKPRTRRARSCRLTAVFNAVVSPGTGFDEIMPEVDHFQDLGLCRMIAAQLIGYGLARCLWTSGKNVLEKIAWLIPCSDASAAGYRA
jgi:hypothetical protein